MAFKMKFILVITTLFLTPSLAFFRDLCYNPLGYGRIDPIISPGRPSQHLHHLQGPGNLGIDSIDADQLLESNCTSCSITVDKSGYWAPAMYFQHENGTLEILSTALSMTIYYKTEKRTNFEDQTYAAFPKGFRMVAGDSLKRNWIGPWPIPEQSLWGPNDTSQHALASKALGFNCMNYHGKAEATFATSYLRDKAFTDAHCLDGVRAEILFPSCWDGVNLDSEDHKSHVLYPTLLQDGACPATHPIYLPILFYETIWNTQQFIGVPGRYVFSNGDPTGYGYHGDFLAAWEDGVLEAVMADPTCTDQVITNRHSGGETEKCSVFTGLIQSPDEAAKCTLQVPEKLMHEKYTGPLTVLPGNMVITGDRHDPGTVPDDVNIPVFEPPRYVSHPGAPKPTPITSHSTAASSSIASISSNTRAPEKSTTPSPTITVSPSSTKAVDPSRKTTTFISNGIQYEFVEVMEIVTVTKTKHVSTVVVSTTVTTAVTTANH